MSSSKLLAVVVSFFMILGLVVTIPGFAQQEAADPAAVPQDLRDKAKVDQPWEKLADTNKDGIVDSVEIRQWKEKKAGDPGAGPEGSIQDRAAVDKPWEKIADTNQDGIIDEVEMNQWRERKSFGDPGAGPEGSIQDRAAVDKPWEKKADVNQDGVVDETEINQWREKPRKDWDNNPPGPKGGPGSDQGSNVQQAAEVNRPWEKAADVNKDGSVDRKEFGQWNKQGNNPPGRVGGPGRSGPGGGQGMRKPGNNPPGSAGGQGRGMGTKPGGAGGAKRR
ncbi:MAG: hypothetical protein PHG40_05600 [Candidatus Omnitrophica bacterium]|nr:hypothetical protein [Candidatus Omnitrophota bacterium]